MTITHHVHCDACNRMLANGPERQPALLALTQDIAEPPSITHWHFCHQGCLASWLTKAVERAVADRGRAEVNAAASRLASLPDPGGDTGQDAARTGGAHANAN